MRLKSTTFIALFVVTLIILNEPSSVDASFWDGIPFISQAKSFFQLITGDADGAKKTQENFLNQAPVISQAKSYIEALAGDEETARKTQEQFLHETIEPVVDNTPIIGHIKGGIHLAAGDKERGEQILKGATSSTVALASGLVCGPACSILGATASDGLITGIDSAINREYKPFGVVEFASNIHNASAGDIFDQLADIGSEFAGGKATRKTPMKNTGFGADGTFKRIIPPPEIDGKRLKPNSHIPIESQLDVSNVRHLEIARRNIGLPETHYAKLTAIDFRVINDVQGNMNCYFCSLAALKGKTVSELVKQIGDDPFRTGAPDVPAIVELYKRAGLQNTEWIFHGTKNEFFNYLYEHLKEGESTEFELAFRREDGSGHVIHMRVWRLQPWGSRINMLTTDFQKAPYMLQRYSTELPANVDTLNIIKVIDKNEIFYRLYDIDKASRDPFYQSNIIQSAYARNHHSNTNSRGFGNAGEFIDGPIRETAIKRQRIRGRRLYLNTTRSRIDLKNSSHFQLQRQKTGLPPSHYLRLQPADFRLVADVQGNKNCYYCLLAALGQKTVTELSEEIGAEPLPNGPPTNQYILDLYARAGFSVAEIIFEGSPQAFLEFLDNKLNNGESTQFSLAFRRLDDTGHIIHVRAWKAWDGTAHLLSTDFQQPPYSNDRFSSVLPDKVATFFIVSPMTIQSLDDDDFSSQMDAYQDQLYALLESKAPDGHKCSNNRRIIAYVPNWSKRQFTIEQSLSLTNAIYAFVQMSADGSLMLPNQTFAKERLIDLMLARRAHLDNGLSLKVSFAVGGWTNSQHFSNVLNNNGSRGLLISEIERTIEQYHFDGVDIDWEYPITGGATEGTPGLEESICF